VVNKSDKDFVTPLMCREQTHYMCSHVGCQQMFSRKYTLKIHEKSHELYSNYYEYKGNPQVFLDPNRASVLVEQARRVNERTELPPLIQRDIDILRRNATTSVSALSTVSNS